jgi:anti-sigma-K factor RskA
MDTQEYISSGILELYVAGALSEKENLEVAAYAEEYPEINDEIIAIEKALLELTKISSTSKPYSFTKLKEGIYKPKQTKVIPLEREKTVWPMYLGWAASLLFAMGLFWSYNQNQNLKSELEAVSQQNSLLEVQIADADASLENTRTLLNTIRDKNIDVVPLAGQTVAPDAYAKVYWNKTEQKVFIDAKGLPEPPDGFVYQIWSLKLSPTLTPTSIGILDTFNEDENKVFALENSNASEAFGITLEPAGGSESPNLEQLYTLGAVSAS